MEGKLNQLYRYLLNNHYTAEAKKLKEIFDEELPDSAIEKVKEMCTPRYLGDLYIQEFDNAYKWWNFLGEVSAEIEISFDGERAGQKHCMDISNEEKSCLSICTKKRKFAVPCEKIKGDKTV